MAEWLACWTRNPEVPSSSPGHACIQLFQLTLSDFKASSLRDKTESQYG